MAVLFHSDVHSCAPWRDALVAELPDLDVRIWPETGPLEDIDVLASWLPPAGLIPRLPALKLLQCLGAGTDQLSRNGEIPESLTVARLMTEDQIAGMVEYLLAVVLRYHRALDTFARDQAQHKWQPIFRRRASETTIAVLGLGPLGRTAAMEFARLGFEVLGWSRSQKTIEGVTSHAGEDGLDRVLARADMVVCLLPFAEETRGLLNRETFRKMPKGAKLINVSRGALLIESDLLEALESQWLSAATLDVFETEPLPEHSLLWDHPAITITPHIATSLDPVSGAQRMAENIRRMEKGLAPLDIVKL